MNFRTKVNVSMMAAVMYLLAVSSQSPAQTEDLSVLGGWIAWSDAANGLQHTLNATAFRLLENRQAAVRNLKSAGDWRARQSEIRKALFGVVGPFSEKTPLNARILSSLGRDGYAVEKVVFESLPGFYATACLYTPPQRGGPAPAILYLSGHTDEAFRNPRYQHVILNLVKKGFVVLALDPIGQGERLQYYDPATKRSTVGGATTEHSYLGKQCFLAGSSAARYFTWDGIRAIDYLISRPEVDPKRIGVTGLSGGGTQTAYIAALDDRVAAAAPSCYITSYRRLLESIGPQDAEQNFNAGLLHGLDHADILEVRAPRATLEVTTTSDFFSIQGARETFAEAKQAFRILGAENNLDMVEDDFGHGYTKKNLRAIYAFFQKHLNNPGSPEDEELEPLPKETVTVTQSGQVSDSLGGETVFSINRAEAGKLIDRLDKSRGNLSTHLQRVRMEAKRLSGYRDPAELQGIVFRGRLQRPGYRIEKYVLPGEGSCRIPILFMLPDKGNKLPALVYLHPQGKSAAAAAGGEAERLVRMGNAVLLPDLSGTGETGKVTDAIAFIGVQVGRSIAGIRAAEIAQCVRFLRTRQDIDADRIGAVAREQLTVPLLHAAAFNEIIGKIALIEPLISYQSVVMNRFYSMDPGALIADVLTAYDLPDLAACLAPRKLLMMNCMDQLRKPAAAELVDNTCRVIRDAYAKTSSEGNLIIKSAISDRDIEDSLRRWLQ